MIIVKGFYGFLSFLIPVVIAALLVALHDKQDFINDHLGLVLFLSLFVSSGIISLFCRNYNNKREYEWKHTIFFVPAEYLFLVWVLMGLIAWVLPTSTLVGLF